MFDIIAAVDERGGLARAGAIPWKSPEDMAFFRRKTAGSSVIMGRRTWESLPRALQGRVNIVVGSVSAVEIMHGNTDTPIIFVSTFDAALDWATRGRIFVIGGAQIYRTALADPRVRKVYLTIIPGDYDCDLFFPMEALPKPYTARRQQNEYRKYNMINREETAWQDMIRRLITAPSLPNRTDTAARVAFHDCLRFRLENFAGDRIMPLITTKFTSLRTIFYELMWFMRGDTNTKYLHDHGVHIWDGNSSAEFLRERGLDYEPGNIGPGYGRQWRDCEGVDQLAEAVRLLREDPMSRRILVSAWNVARLPEMALPPCHYSFQFVTTASGATAPDSVGPQLNCIVNMRSGDAALGVPFNIASYALLTHIIAHIVNMRPGELVISIANSHLYETHVRAATEIVGRTPYGFPTLEFSDKIKKIKDLDEFVTAAKYGDIRLKKYLHRGRINMPMAI